MRGIRGDCGERDPVRGMQEGLWGKKSSERDAGGTVGKEIQ